MTPATKAVANPASASSERPDPVTLALDLARSIGAAVLPVRADKTPAIANGVHGATNDPELIVAAFIETGAPLVGVACGASGLVVVDIDRHPGGADGFASIESAGAELPASWSHASLSGAGAHHVYAAPAGNLTGAKPLPAVDVKAGAGYIVWTGDVPASRAAFAPAPSWTVTPARPLVPVTWTAGVAAWMAENDGAPVGAVTDAIAALPPHGELAEPDLYGHARRIAIAAQYDFGGAEAMAELRGRYASGEWAGPKYLERVNRAITRAIEAEGAPRRAGLDIEATIEGWLSEAGGAWQPAAFRVLSRSELRSRPRPEWFIDGLLQGSGVLVLAGQGGIGKSFLALDWAAHLATGSPWYGRDTRPARVLYVAAEGAEFFPDRLDAWEARNGATVPEDALQFVESGFNLSDPQGVADMRRLVAEDGYDLIILDTLSQLAAVESENDNAQLAAVLRAARSIREARAGASVLIVHHVSKSERGRVRGASAIRDNADSVIVARTDGQGFALSTQPEHDGKMKNGRAEYLPGFRLETAGESAVIVRDGIEVDLDSQAIDATLSDGQPHLIGDFLGRRGDMSEATSKRIRTRLQTLVEEGKVITDGATRGKRWQSIEGVHSEAF